MWRLMGLRDEQAWYVWDGIERQGTVRPLAEADAPDQMKAEKMFVRLEAYRQQAVNPGPIVTDEHIPELRGENQAVKRRLRSLGYLDF